MKIHLILLLVVLGMLIPASTSAAVQISVLEGHGLAVLQYHCTMGEVVRCFALNVTVDNGKIVGVSDYFRGPSMPFSQGYGFFPGSFRDHIVVDSNADIDWSANEYSPLAVRTDSPAGTLPGLNSNGVTLELGALWDPNDPMTIPPPSGTLCSLQLSQGANVSVSANTPRGGILASDPDAILSVEFKGAFVQPPEIISFSVLNGIVSIAFSGGELETASDLSGPWTPTGNSTGIFNEAVADQPIKFYRVQRND